MPNFNIFKSILPDHHDQFAEIFDQINDLIEDHNYDAAANRLAKLHYADLADFLDNLNNKTYKIIIPLLQDEIKPETLVSLNAYSKPLVIETLGIKKSAELINKLVIEDAIEVVIDLDDDIKDLILSNLTKEKKHQITIGCTYPENTVGRVIERDFINLQEGWTVEESLNFIKNIKNDFYAAIVTDNKLRPIGIISLSTLIKGRKNALIKDLMSKDFKLADAFTDLNELSFIFRQYALTIVPVVNKSGKLVGSVSIDNIIYIIEEQAGKDILSLSGVHTQDTFFNVFYTVKHRFPWLFVNLITACMTSLIINHFNDTIAKLVTLAATMPIVASMGGNAGTQAMTVTVRALANKDIHYNNVNKVILKEIAVSAFNGFVLAIIGAGLSFVMLLDLNLSVIFAIAVILNFLVAGLCGSAIPIILHYFDIDPATGSGVFLTTITDALGFLTFLSLAHIFLV
ncbi:MAG: magnesium transporter [Rickettsia conorii subsp. raoultii]|uniref:Magnesium transporter MgtE n=1 Tax=Rickettsia conorii subsp. raoultii TaxID=369822 RepID=A0A9N7AWW2_RICCR|nr:magnesium transporter [Rickettsia conorii]AJQ52001.1 magnesium transporter [Rickettsia conorii subsp. raoultii]APZ30241.1 magnesium transporter [Rickettsia conorii subsp. raoultii]URW77474.1 magnesium transporter [Rickettsia conorii subsp. raoultii]